MMCRANPGAYSVFQFNIIYIMRTKVKVCGLCRPGLILGVSPAANQASAAPTAHAAEQIRFSTGHKPPGFTGCLLLPDV